MINKCAYCGKEYKTYHRNSKFCSRECSAKNQDRKIEMTCAYCGKKFMAYRYRAETQKFCSQECHEKAQFHLGYDGTNKMCTSCGKIKPLSDFNNGYTKCKDCRAKYVKKYYEENKEKVLLQCKKYREKHREEHAQRNKIYRENNREYVRQYMRKWREKNREKWREQKRKDEQTRRARKVKAADGFTEDDWKTVLKYFNHSCAYCGKTIDSLTQDHFIPVAKGGGYVKENIIPSCMHCNQSKGDKDFEEWYPTYAYFSIKRANKIMQYIGENTEARLMETDGSRREQRKPKAVIGYGDNTRSV